MKDKLMSEVQHRYAK